MPRLAVVSGFSSRDQVTLAPVLRSDVPDPGAFLRQYEIFEMVKSCAEMVALKIRRHCSSCLLHTKKAHPVDRVPDCLSIVEAEFDY